MMFVCINGYELRSPVLYAIKTEGNRNASKLRPSINNIVTPFQCIMCGNRRRAPWAACMMIREENGIKHLQNAMSTKGK